MKFAARPAGYAALGKIPETVCDYARGARRCCARELGDDVCKSPLGSGEGRYVRCNMVHGYFISRQSLKRSVYDIILDEKKKI